MTFDKRHKNTLLSIFIFLALCTVLYLIAWDSDFVAVGIFYITEIIIILAGVISIALYLLKVKIDKSNFLYNYIGTVNIIIGLFILIKASIKETNINILMTLNFIIGLFILIDIFRKTTILKT